jgi:hypothetical protein
MTMDDEKHSPRKSISARLNDEFKFVYSGPADAASIQVSGPMATRGQLDAVVEALNVMRDWLPETCEGGEA